MLFQLVVLTSLCLCDIARGGLLDRLNRFTAVKADNGSVMCAVNSPDVLLTTGQLSRVRCGQQCVNTDQFPCSGYNFRTTDNTCELFANYTVRQYEVQSDCKHYTVGAIRK